MHLKQVLPNDIPGSIIKRRNESSGRKENPGSQVRRLASFGVCDRRKPVSYTHLDVYKRQLQESEDCILEGKFLDGYKGESGNYLYLSDPDVYKRQELMNDYPVHTKTVLIDNRLSVVGSYNLDMRSTYLDTELMLVIDSKRLNQQIRTTENDYMEKSKEILANGQETEGAKYEKKILTWQKKLFYGALRIIIRPLRQLL